MQHLLQNSAYITHSLLIQLEIMELQSEVQAPLSLHWGTTQISAWFSSLLNIHYT